MAKVTCDKQLTALLVIDPHNDFISEGGKIWDRLNGVAEPNKCVRYMFKSSMLRESGHRGLYALHRRYRAGDDENWKYIAPVQKAAWVRKSFENTARGVARCGAS